MLRVLLLSISLSTLSGSRVLLGLSVMMGCRTMAVSSNPSRFDADVNAADHLRHLRAAGPFNQRRTGRAWCLSRSLSYRDDRQPGTKIESAGRGR